MEDFETQDPLIEDGDDAVDELASSEDDNDMGDANTSRAVSPSKLTARQRARGNKDLQETLLTLPEGESSCPTRIRPFMRRPSVVSSCNKVDQIWS